MKKQDRFQFMHLLNDKHKLDFIVYWKKVWCSLADLLISNLITIRWGRLSYGALEPQWKFEKIIRSLEFNVYLWNFVDI